MKCADGFDVFNGILKFLIGWFEMNNRLYVVNESRSYLVRLTK